MMFFKKSLTVFSISEIIVNQPKKTTIREINKANDLKLISDTSYHLNVRKIFQKLRNQKDVFSFISDGNLNFPAKPCI